MVNLLPQIDKVPSTLIFYLSAQMIQSVSLQQATTTTVAMLPHVAVAFATAAICCW